MKPLKGQGLPTPRSGAAWLGGETVSVLSEGARMAALKATDTWTPPLETLSQSGGGGRAQRRVSPAPQVILRLSQS